jgi:hypothetical protein
MADPIELIKRRSMGMGHNQPAFDKIEHFQGPFVRFNPLLMHNYGRNIYQKGERIGYCIDVRICGYRGLPINQIQALVFEVDGELIPDARKYIWYGGRRFPYFQIGTGRFDNDFFWKYTDYLRVFFDIPGGIPQGIHHVKYGLALRDHYSSTAYCEKDVTIV